MLLREADYLHPRLPGNKTHLHYGPIPYWAGWEGTRVFLPCNPFDKLVKRMCEIVLSMWVNMPEEEAVGWNSIFMHLIEGLPSFSSRALQKVSCSFPLLF